MDQAADSTWASAASQSITTSRSSPSGMRLAGTVLPGYSSGTAAAGTGLPTWIWYGGASLGQIFGSPRRCCVIWMR